MLSVKSSMARWLAHMAMAISAVTGIVVVASPASPALAACSQEGCDNLDPQAQGCSSGARSMPEAIWTESGSLGAGVELRYSPTCRAMWTRLTVDYSYDPTRGPIYIRVHRQEWNNQALAWQNSGVHTKKFNATTGTTWTTMVGDYSSGDRTKACWSFRNTSNFTCTGWQ
jgi:hypothetical protein